MATYYSSYSNQYRLRLDITQGTQNVANNTSVVSWTLYLESGWNSLSVYSTYHATINGVASPNTTQTNVTIGFNTSVSLGSGSTTVTHNSDGTKSVPFSASYKTNSAVYYQGALVTPSSTMTISGNFALTTIPRASSFTLSGATRTNADINVAISRKSTAFTHKVRYKVGTGSWIDVASSAGTSASFKVQPGNMANLKSATITVGVQTLSSGTAIGSEATATRTITIPDSTISLSGTAVTGNTQTVNISNSGGSGLTYTRSWKLGNATGGDSNTWIPPHNALSGASSGTLTCTVVTKNGTATINTTSATRTITSPNVSSFTLSGATQTNANITVSISKTSSSFNHRVRWRVSGSTSWKEVQAYTWTGTSTSFKVQPSDIPNSKSKEIEVGVQTYSGSTTIGSEVISKRTVTIPNTTITLGGTANTGSVQTVTVSNSGGSLTHTKSWKLGSATGGDSLTWTPPHSALPNATSGTLTCTVVTKNGTATVNTVSATRTISVPTGEQPTFTAITHTEAVTNVATLVGAYVQGQTKLKLGVSGAAAATGSSIKSYSISVAGHTVGNGETTPVINQSGTLTISATVTDNRNRSVTKTTTITVLPYENPAITGVSFTRSNADGTANSAGTHLTIKGTVRVRRLVVGTEKNKIRYESQSGQVGHDYETKTTLTNQAGTINGNYREAVYTHTFDTTDLTHGGYHVDYPYNVRVRGGDIFGWTGYITGIIPTGVVLQHWGEDTTSFGKMIDDTSYNVLVGSKGLKSDGPIIDKDGKDVSKPSWSDVSSKPAQATRWPTWSEVTSKPSTFAPSSHSHAWSEVTSKPTTATRWPAWSEVTGKPSVFNSDAIQIPDTRSVVSVPQNLALKAVTAEFKNNSSVGNPPVNASATYSHIINVAGWSDGSGGWPSQISVGAGGLAVRQATSATAWGAWKDVSKPTWSDVSSKPAQATRWPTWSEVTSKPSTFTSIATLYSGSVGAQSSATMTSMSGYTFLVVVMYVGGSATNRDTMVIPVANISYSTAGDSYSRISFGAALRYINFSFGSATNIRTGNVSEFLIKTIYGVK